MLGLAIAFLPAPAEEIPWFSKVRYPMRTLRFSRSLAEFVLFVSLPLTFAPLVLFRPPAPFFALPLAPIALAAVLHEFAGGTLIGLLAMAVAAVVIALDPNSARRAVTLQETLPILIMYLAVGPFVGWLATRERERKMRWASHLAAIGDASREIAASLDLERTLRLVMEKAAETLPMDAGALFQFDAHEQAFRVAVSHNLSPDHVARITFAFEDGVPGWVVNHRGTLVIPDADADPRVHPYVIEDGVQSVLATPMIAHDHVVGVLNLYCKTSKFIFDDSAVRLAEVYAAQAAVAVENARLVSELRRAAAELEARVERRTRQLRETQAQIIRAEKLAVVGRLAASVAHEVNNPLQSMALQLQLLTDERLSDKIQDRMTILRNEVSRISGIVRRLLDFQRPKPGERSPHSVDDLLEDVLVLAGKQLQNSRVEVLRNKSKGNAYDYLLKPAKPEEILSVVSAAVSVCQRNREESRLLEAIRQSIQRIDMLKENGRVVLPELPDSRSLRLGRLKIDLAAHEVRKNDKPLHLTPSDWSKWLWDMRLNHGRLKS